MTDAQEFMSGSGLGLEDGLGNALDSAVQEGWCATLWKLRKSWSSYIAVIAILIVFVTIILTVLTFVLPCNEDVVVQVKGFTVRDMVVVHNNPTPPEVTNDIDLTLALQNPNSRVRPRCDLSLREVKLSVRYRDRPISFSAPLYLLSTLKPGSSYEVPTTLTGNHSHVLDEAGVTLEAELLRNDNVTFVLDNNVTFAMDSNKTSVNHQICEVVAKSPQQASRPRHRGFLNAKCGEIK